MSVPVVTVWLLAVEVVKTACAPIPIRAMAATPSAPSTAIIRSFM
ncbi:MAG: hypothetical protein ACYDEA_01525 [Candidatus Dormibacteria bacterium]